MTTPILTSQWPRNEAERRAGDRAVQFFRKRLHHTKGSRLAGTPLVPDPWQVQWLREVFGTLTSDGHRRYTTAYLEIPKKNGKTTVTAGCLLKCLYDEGEVGGEVYSCAAKRDQAGKLFEIMAAMVRKSPALLDYKGKRTRIYDREKRIYVPALDSYYQALSSDANVEDGINPSAAAVDELHRHRSRDLLEVVEEGMVARDNPLLFILTTAGGDQTGPAWEVHEHALAVLVDPAIDPSFHVTVYAAPEGVDPGDEDAWFACNPALATGAIDIEKVRATYRKALRSPTKMRSFKRLRLNWWVAGDDKWLDIDEWKACGMDVAPMDPLREWAGRTCWGGLDLSSTSDFTALAWLFARDDGGWDLWVQFFYAKGAVAKRASMSEAVQEWAERGLITLTPGDAVDYAYVAKAVRRGFEAFDVQELGYDPWHAPNVINEPILADVPVVMTKVSQYASVMNAPCRKLETLITERELHHYGNPVLRWMALNAVAEVNAYEAMRPAKNKTKDKIDGLTATIIALERAIAPREEPKRSAVFNFG